MAEYVFNIEKAKGILARNYKPGCYQDSNVWVEGPEKLGHGRWCLCCMVSATLCDGALYNPHIGRICIDPSDVDIVE